MTDSKSSRVATGHLTPFGLRLQPDLKDRLMESAAKAGRSLNAELVARLESTFQRTEQEGSSIQLVENMVRIIHRRARRVGLEVTLLNLDVKVLELLFNQVQQDPHSIELQENIRQALQQLRIHISDINNRALEETADVDEIAPQLRDL